MRLAYFSPLLPKRTGIATYSHHLVEALASHAEIDVFDTGEIQLPQGSHCQIDYQRHPGLLAHLTEYDAVIYQIGNNPHFHLDIFRVLLLYPGIVVLHDTVLYYLFAGQGFGGFVKDFCLNYGADRLSECWMILRESPDEDILRYNQPNRYPLLKRVLEAAKTIIVHSETAKSVLENEGYSKPIHTIPLLAYPSFLHTISRDESIAVRARYRIPSESFLIGYFGFVGQTKRLGTLLDALVILRQHPRLHAVMVGEGVPLREEAERRGLTDLMTLAGFVPEDDFPSLMNACDVIVNLRYPSHGETSAVQIQAMSLGRPTIVTDYAWFSELPSEAAIKIRFDESEVSEVVRAIEQLMRDESMRVSLGQNARIYINERCHPDSVARCYLETIGSVMHRRALKISDTAKLFSKEYLARRVTALIP